MIKQAIIPLIILYLSGYADAEGTKKTSIAIMEFRANNTKEAYGKACVDILSEKLFATNHFTLMEKSQMDRIARQSGFREYDISEPEQVARLGRVLNVDKLIVGSITYLDSFIINVTVLNSSTGEIELNVKRKISRIKNLDDALEEIALAIERHYLGYDSLSGSFDIAVEGDYLLPYGVLGNLVNRGAGILAVLLLNKPFDNPVSIQGITGYYKMCPADASLDYFYMFPFYLCAAYKFNPAGNLAFIPSAGAGYIFTKLSGDGSADADKYRDDKQIYYNPALLIRVELDILLYDRWYLVITPQYNLFFEKERAGQFMSIGLGFKMLF